LDGIGHDLAFSRGGYEGAFCFLKRTRGRISGGAARSSSVRFVRSRAIAVQTSKAKSDIPSPLALTPRVIAGFNVPPFYRLTVLPLYAAVHPEVEHSGRACQISRTIGLNRIDQHRLVDAKA